MSTLRITYRVSAIGHSQRQKDTIRSLGLRKLHHSVDLPDRPDVRGLRSFLVLVWKPIRTLSMSSSTPAAGQFRRPGVEMTRQPHPAQQFPHIRPDLTLRAAGDAQRQAVKVIRPGGDAPEIEAFEDHHAGTVQRPVTGHHCRVAPSHQVAGGGLDIGGNEARGTGIGQHRGVGRDVGAAPLSQLQPLRLDHGDVARGLDDSHHAGVPNRADFSLRRV